MAVGFLASASLDFEAVGEKKSIDFSLIMVPLRNTSKNSIQVWYSSTQARKEGWQGSGFMGFMLLEALSFGDQNL